MEIKTEGHGSFPSDVVFEHSGPRIAFVNADGEGRHLQATRLTAHALVVAADDVGELVIPTWAKPLLRLPWGISKIAKRQLWRMSLRKGFPFAPFCLDDAMRILEFHRSMVESGCPSLMISCEYGKSRSVTTANFLSGVSRYPNGWVASVLELAAARMKGKAS